MAKRRSRLLDFGVYLTARLAICVLQVIPLAWSQWLVDHLARLAYRVDRRHREVAIDNLRHAFPGLYTEEQLHALTLGVYRHFGRTLLESVFLQQCSRSRHWREAILTDAPPEALAALKSGRPILVVTAHFGSWEAAAFVLNACGFRAHLVARELDNPYLESLARWFRESNGNKVLSKHGDLGRMKEVLLRGGILCTLGDQDAGRRGMFVDFFGRPASTHRVMAHLARRTGALILVVGAEARETFLDYQIRLTDIIDPQEYDRHADPIFAITQRITRGIERLVRGAPTQYLWLHRRWKHRPPSDQSVAA